MARQSTASLSVVRVSPDSRLAPPDGLDDAERALWEAVVSTKPAEWFADDSAPLLKEYVRAAVMCDALDLQVKAATAGGEMGEVKALLDMRDKESKRVLSIATKLRLVCKLAARMNEGELGVQASSVLSGLLSKLGATPVDESRVLHASEADDPDEAFFSQRSH